MKFDASQYAFFNKGSMEEVELGGLEEDDYIGNDGFANLDDEDFSFSAIGDREEVISNGHKIVIGCLFSLYILLFLSTLIMDVWGFQSFFADCSKLFIF